MSDRTKGILFITLSAFFFAGMILLVRLAGDLPSVQKSFFRNFVAMIFAAAVLIKRRVSLIPRKEHLLGLICRAGFGTIGILFNYYAIDHLTLADASMLNKMSPFFVAIFSIFLLKEKLSLRQLLVILTAFIGSLFILKPGFAGLISIPALAGLGSGITAGAAYTFMRYLTLKGAEKPYIVFFFSAFSCLTTLPYFIFAYHPMTATQLITLLGAGLCAAGGQFSITTAYSYAPAREISVYDYSIVIFSAILGFIFFRQVPDALSVLGYIIIFGAALYQFLYGKSHPQEESGTQKA